jgi:hypothetical protein
VFTRHRLFTLLLKDLRKLLDQARSDRPAPFCNKKCVISFLRALRAYENEYPAISIVTPTSESPTGKSLSLFTSYRSMRRLIDAQARCEGRGRNCRLYRHLRSTRGECEKLISGASKRAVARVSEERRSWVDPFEG